MKTIITAIVALTIQFSAVANPHDTTENIIKPASEPTAVTKESKMVELNRIKDEKVSTLNYMRTMQNTLSLIERNKHIQAIDNLEAENAYNRLMSAMLTKVEEDKLSSKMEDVEAMDRYNHLMKNVLNVSVQ